MISVVITVGRLTGGRCHPVVCAVKENLANAGVRDVHVLSEEPLDWLMEDIGSDAERVYLHSVATRPLFSEMFEVGNRLLQDGAGTVAVMNADISIATNDDATRILHTFDSLTDLCEPVVLTLARHEKDGTRSWIALYDGCGLPNYLSADCWVFQQPIVVRRELFYGPGQMNCDMFLAHDLIDSGYRLFNPCLDIVLKHHEVGKEHAFYAEKLTEEAVQHMLWRHVAQNNIDPFNYLGVPWTKTAWLRQGYRPHPLGTHRKRVMLAVPAGCEECLGTHIQRLSSIGSTYGFELQILCDGDLDRLMSRNMAQLARLPEIAVSRPEAGLADLRKALLAGLQYGFKRVAFVGDLSQVTPAVLSEAEGVFVGVGKVEPSEDLTVGCTLITSVFRSDPFIRGFINNSVALVGYDLIIDHVFLVAKLSEIEIAALAELLACKPNVLVFWNKTDPGLYSCWNVGLRMARWPYVSNANVDDLRDPAHVVTLIRILEAHPEVLVAATAINPFDHYPEDGRLPEVRAAWYSDQNGPFGFFDIARLSQDNPPKLIPHNMPHCMPIWRRSLHDRHGWFDEARFGTYADWAFWLKALRDGALGWMERAPLGFYFVNPTSHNRRGTDLERLHTLVEDEYLGSFLAHRRRTASYSLRPTTQTVPKLNLTGRNQQFGQHRNDFNRLISALDPLDRADARGYRVIPFLERYFVWGDAPGEANSGDPRPITDEWIGILHVPFDAPQWFNPEVSPEVFFRTSLWQQSKPYCRGIITLCADLEADLRAYDPALPTLAVRHPTELDVQTFDFQAYRAQPRVVQVGDWLRKLQAIHRLHAPAHQRVMLLKRWTENYLQHEINIFGDHRDPNVTTLRMVPNDQYDQLLASSVVLCLMFATAANNVVVECIARATPLLINPLPAAVEYLGLDYPLYVSDEAEAAHFLNAPTRILAAHEYLLRRRDEIDLTYAGFSRNIATSEFYNRL